MSTDSIFKPTVLIFPVLIQQNHTIAPFTARSRGAKEDELLSELLPYLLLANKKVDEAQPTTMESRDSSKAGCMQDEPSGMETQVSSIASSSV